MCVLSKIFGDYPQVKILEAFVDNIDDELSTIDLQWLTDLHMITINDCVSKLLNEKILVKSNDIGNDLGNIQCYRLNYEKQEVQLMVSLVNYIITEKLSKKLKERGLEAIV